MTSGPDGGGEQTRHAVAPAHSGVPGPVPPGPAPAPGLSVAAVARRLGVAPATLRTWDRRYGLGPSDHHAGSHRRYTAADLARLEHMRRLVIAGVPPADAARDALALDVDPTSLAPVTALPAPPLPPARSGPYADPTGLADRRSGGGQVVPIPGGTPAARGLARAALSLDSQACIGIVADTLERRGVVWTWDHLLVPVLQGVGQRWESTGRGIEVEHVLSQAIQSAFGSVVARLTQPVNARTVLLACADEEMHSLPLWAVAASLAERRLGSRVLGARVPLPALEHAIRRTGPAAVVVWSQVPATGSTEPLATLPELRPAPLVLVAGPGWQEPLPSGVHRVYDLTETVARIARAVGD